MKHWIFLTLAILCEVIGTSALKASDGFSKTGATVLVVAGYGAAFYFLSLTLKAIPVGVAYAIWAGAGIVLIAIVSRFLFAQKLDAPAVLGMALIISGVLVIHLFSATSGH